MAAILNEDGNVQFGPYRCSIKGMANGTSTFSQILSAFGVTQSADIQYYNSQFQKYRAEHVKMLLMELSFKYQIRVLVFRNREPLLMVRGVQLRSITMNDMNPKKCDLVLWMDPNSKIYILQSN